MLGFKGWGQNLFWTLCEILGLVPHQDQNEINHDHLLQCVKSQPLSFFMFQNGSRPFALVDVSEVAHQDVTLTTDCFQIGHGKSTFLKGERVQKMQREAAGSATTGGLGPYLLDDGVNIEIIPIIIWNGIFLCTTEFP